MTEPHGKTEPRLDIEHFQRVLTQLRAELDQPANPTADDERAVNELLGLDEVPESSTQSLW